MKYFLYGMAWSCILMACVYAGFAEPRSTAEPVAALLLLCALLLGGTGYAAGER